MSYISVRIHGVPYSKQKARGKVNAPRQWQREIILQTEKLPRVTDACILKATFLLPANKYPKGLRYGSDLDNLLKNLLDGLKETIFSGTEGGDSCIVALSAMKTRVREESDAGADLEILPVKVT